MSEELTDELALLEFRLAGQRFAIAAELVTEVLPMLPLRRLPGAPEVLLGVASVRGVLLPLLDPRPRLGLAPWLTSVTAHIVAVRAGGHSLGLVVDSAEDVFTVAWQDLCRPGELEPRIPYSLGLVRRPPGEVVFVDVDALVLHDEWGGLARAVDAP